MWSLWCKRKHLISLFIIGAVLYTMFDCVSFDNVHGMLNMLQCRGHGYPSTYYRKRIAHKNDTFYVYNIKIGQIYARSLSATEIQDLSDQIADDLIWYKYRIDQNGASSIARKHLYDEYYNDLYTKSNTHCASSTAHIQRYDEMDFFEFIHLDAKHTNDPRQTPINWYRLLPIQDVLNDTYYTSTARHIQRHITDEYFLPKLYTYTLSVDKSGYLPTLQLRFGEIANEIQHDLMKHLMLNNNQRHILWAGEFYDIYDYKYGKYVLLMDNASGHWKPNAKKIPQYLHTLLVETLFPHYNISLMKEDSDGGYQYKNYYRPLILLGYHDHPWYELKSILFTVVEDIKDLYRMRRTDRISKLSKMMRAQYARNKKKQK